MQWYLSCYWCTRLYIDSAGLGIAKLHVQVELKCLLVVFVYNNCLRATACSNHKLYLSDIKSIYYINVQQPVSCACEQDTFIVKHISMLLLRNEMHASHLAGCLNTHVLHTLQHVGLGVHGQVVGVVAEEGEEVPVHCQLQGRLSEGATKGLSPSLGHLETPNPGLPITRTVSLVMTYKN